MPEVKCFIKTALCQRCISQKRLAEALGLDYQKLNRIINGFDPAPFDFDKRCFDFLENYDKTQILNFSLQK